MGIVRLSRGTPKDHGRVKLVLMVSGMNGADDLAMIWLR